MSLDHRTVRISINLGFKRKFGREPTVPEAQFLHAVGMLETSCGTGWKGVGAGSFNMGAITAGPHWSGMTFEYKDSYPDAQGIDHWYVTKFRKYADAPAGWEDLANIMYEDRPSVLKAASAGDGYGVSSALYETKYYAGRGKSAKERISGHYAALTRNLITICTALNEPMPGGSEIPKPTLRRGCTGEDVKTVQRWFNLTKDGIADGIFGPNTETAVKEFQRSHGLEPDGVIGDATWDKLDEVFDSKVASAQVVGELESYIAALVAKAKALQVDLTSFVEASQAPKKE